MAVLRRVGLYVLLAGVFWGPEPLVSPTVLLSGVARRSHLAHEDRKGLTGAAAETLDRALTQEELCAGWPELIAEAQIEVAASAILRSVQQNCD